MVVGGGVGGGAVVMEGGGVRGGEGGCGKNDVLYFFGR